MSSRHGSPLYLKRIQITNIRCFENLSIGLDSPSGHRKWAVIFGDNGVGKTTLLRCIAIGMCDEASASGLLREIYGEWNRQDNGELLPGVIRLEFFANDEKNISIETRIIPSDSGYSSIERTTHFGRIRKTFPWDRIFACGYGSARRAFGSRDIEDYATVDAVYTLFNYDTPLQNPELVLRRIMGLGDAGRARISAGLFRRRSKALRGLLDQLASVLTLPPGSIKLTTRGLTISGPWGDFQPIGGLGDGFQATLAWLSDLLGWALLFNPRRRISNVRGIVLIDELEQHLHPSWQRCIIGLLRQQFPFIQFIATTHTPMCAVGTTDLRNTECELIKLNREGNAVIAIENIPPPRHQRADQVLTSMLFDLPTSGDNKTVNDIATYHRLLSMTSLTKADRMKKNELKKKLTEEFQSAESPLEERARRLVSRALQAQADEVLNDPALKIEIEQRLRRLTTNAKN